MVVVTNGFSFGVCGMGLFKKAADKAKAKSSDSPKKKKQTLWRTSVSPEVDSAVSELRKLSSKMKEVKAQMDLPKQVVYDFASTNFIESFTSNGVLPETPMKVVNGKGESVTFVVQDRSSQYTIKDDQYEMLEEVLGEDAAEDVVYTETTIQFNRDVLAVEGVSEVVEKALESAMRKIVKMDLVSEEVAEELIQVNEKRALKPGTITRAAEVSGRNASRLEAFLDIVGSSCTRYVKP